MSDSILAELAEIVGENRVLTGSAVSTREFPWSTHDACLAKAIVEPDSVDQVSAILRACYRRGQPVVPFGGSTNLVQACATTSNDIVLSLARLNRIEELDPRARTLTAESGVTLADAQQAAAEQNLFFPVDIGARTDCQLGGIAATNAGGNKVVRFGMTRDTVLGLEAVLADGTVISSMNRYIKNNSGFDLKHLFIGSEGVLGVITRLVFRLRTQPRSHDLALLACSDYASVLELMEMASRELPGTLSAFEVMWGEFYERAVAPRGRIAAPLEHGAAYYVLIESMGGNPAGDEAVFAAMLDHAMDAGHVIDGVLAKSDKERQRFWDIRDEVEPVIENAQNFDVSLRGVDIGGYVQAVSDAIRQRFTEAAVIAFGHLADNNVHLSVSGLERSGESRTAVEAIVYGSLEPYGGAISAEHGIGLEKRAYLPVTRTADEIALMRTMKQTLDPKNILNPGKVVGPPPE